MPYSTQPQPTTVSEQHSELIAEFHALIARHPEAAGKFVLAHLPEGAPEQEPSAVLVHGPIVWECETTDFGLDCRPVILEE
ncbi:hypothetical protein [Nocardia mexicana]|uniref:Uncharacterized protein n=1 Tax=Nocardia mexicana TaxID=279262 RepID=A0A370HAT0_9NOCA|nr:hypothetical protein [Nocardia mexicana]RDI54042.1 hypothetical protein DFR68_102164 [Nocardia mexicana]